MNYQKYVKMYHPVPLENREWPEKEITHAPVWCSVDLRDGNQALYSPMTIDEKIEFFQFLVKLLATCLLECHIDVLLHQ